MRHWLTLAVAVPIAAANVALGGGALHAAAHAIVGAPMRASVLRLPPRTPEPVAAPHGGAAVRPPAAPATVTPTTAVAAPTLLQSREGMSESIAGASFADQNVAPADVSIATGPADVIEAADSTLTIFRRDSTLTSLAVFDLNSTDSNPSDNFLGLQSGWAARDPRVVYDSGSGRFYLSALEYQTAGSGTAGVILTTDSADPTASWSGFQLPNQALTCVSAGCNSSLPAYADRPALGYSAAVVTLAWNYYNGSLSGPWYGSQIDVVQKSDLVGDVLTSNTADAFIHGPFSPQPAVSLGSAAVQYVAFNNSDSANGSHASIGVVAISGQPEQQNVSASSESDLPITQTSGDSATGGTHPAPQAGTAATLQTGDDRLSGAVWSSAGGGTLWTSGDTNCTPTGDASVRTCLDVVSITASSAGAVSGSQQIASGATSFIGVNGSYLYDPAISTDGSGRAFLVYDQSAASTAESIMVSGVVGGTVSAALPVHTSATYYDPGGGLCGAAGCAWGDYSGAAQDPAHPGDVWVVSEDTDGDTTPALCAGGHYCWNSYLARYTYTAPAVATLTPAAGPAAGGQTVTVSGSDFAPSSTITFAGSAAQLVSGTLTPDTFQFTTQAHAAGAATLQVTDAIGSGSADYFYVGLGSFIPVNPTRILDTRFGTGTCTPSPCGSLGPGTTLTLQVTSAGGPVPASANPTAVVLNVTAVNPTSASLLTVYPTGTSQPLASNLNFSAQTNMANLVTAVLGQGGAVNIYNALGADNVVADVAGYFAPQSASAPQGEFHAIAPVRVCDTRAGQPANPCNGNGGAGTDTRLGASASVKVNVTATGTAPDSIPHDGTAEAAVLNLTAVAASQGTYLSVFPPDAAGNCPYGGAGGSPPSSSINVGPGSAQANRVMVPLGPATTGAAGTDVCVYNAAGSVNVLLDANGWFGSATATVGAQYQAIGPARICDTRPGSGEPCQASTLGAGSPLLVPVAGVSGIPPATAGNPPVGVIANLTAVNGSSATYLTMYPADVSLPNASDINLGPGQVLPNLIVAKLASTAHPGEVDLYNALGSIDAVLDAEGWFQ